MNYSYEGRVIWHDLSPPIQELLKRLSSNLNNTQNTNFLDLLNQEINRAKKKEQEIYDDLMDEIMAIWGEDGKNTSHDITEIWKKLEEIGAKGDGSDPPSAGGPGLIDIFVINPAQPREFYIHFTNGFKIVGMFVAYHTGNTFNTIDGSSPGEIQSIVKPWMTGFNGYTSESTYTCWTTTDEQGDMGILDQAVIVYTRAISGTEVAMSSILLYHKDTGYKIEPVVRPNSNTQFIICMGY